MFKQVTIVGIGALGSHLVQFIRNEDITIKVIDHDRVEQKNVLSQFHAVKTVGKSKVQSLQQNMKFMFGANINIIPHKLNKDNVDALLENSDLVVDCLDNAEARILIQQYVRQNNIPCLHGALAADGQFGQVMWDERFKIDSENVTGEPTCHAGEQLPFISVISSLLAQSVHEFLVNNRMVSYQISPTSVFRV